MRRAGPVATHPATRAACGRACGLLAGLAALALGCGDPSAPAPADGAERTGVRLDVRRAAPYGAHLVDGDGRSLYVFTADADVPGSACRHACAERWPPLLTRDAYGAEVAARPGDAAIDVSEIGTMRRLDGGLQITYADRPLYRYHEDAPGDRRGHDLQSFEGRWYLLAPSGEVIEVDAASTSDSLDRERTRPSEQERARPVGPRPALQAERIARVDARALERAARARGVRPSRR